MKAFKKTTALLLALLFSVSLTACGGGNSDYSSGEDSSSQEYTLSEFDGGSGGEYDRYEGGEGYYEISFTAGSENYYSFYVSQAGQYALTTLQATTGLTIERYDATPHYIAPTPYPAEVMPNGTLYSLVHCSNTYFNPEWRATYKISSTTNGSVVISFTRVGEPLPEPQNYVTKVEATEIVGKVKDLPANHIKKEIPWTTADNPKYFYDEDYEMQFIDLVTGEETTATGFYRYGEETDENAPVIWVAITSATERYLSVPFSQIQYEGNNLSIHVNTDEDGNHYFNNYVDFIMNNGGFMDNTNGGVPMPGDEDMLCYMNVVNKDGLFPVNQELFDFLKNYTKKQPPSLTEVSVAEENYWLAPCYYYEEAVLGSENNPYLLTAGTNEITLSARETVYYKLEASETTQYTITLSPSLYAVIDKVNYGTDNESDTLTIEVTPDGLLISFTALKAGTYTVTVA